MYIYVCVCHHCVIVWQPDALAGPATRVTRAGARGSRGSSSVARSSRSSRGSTGVPVIDWFRLIVHEYTGTYLNHFESLVTLVTEITDHPSSTCHVDHPLSSSKVSQDRFSKIAGPSEPEPETTAGGQRLMSSYSNYPSLPITLNYYPDLKHQQERRVADCFLLNERASGSASTISITWKGVNQPPEPIYHSMVVARNANVTMSSDHGWLQWLQVPEEAQTSTPREVGFPLWWFWSPFHSCQCQVFSTRHKSWKVL